MPTQNSFDAALLTRSLHNAFGWELSRTGELHCFAHKRFPEQIGVPYREKETGTLSELILSRDVLNEVHTDLPEALHNMLDYTKRLRVRRPTVDSLCAQISHLTRPLVLPTTAGNQVRLYRAVDVGWDVDNNQVEILAGVYLLECLIPAANGQSRKKVAPFVCDTSTELFTVTAAVLDEVAPGAYSRFVTGEALGLADAELADYVLRVAVPTTEHGGPLPDLDLAKDFA